MNRRFQTCNIHVYLDADYMLSRAPANMTLGYTPSVTPSGYVELDHTADWALRVQGTDLADLLEQAAAGMLALAGAVPCLARCPASAP